MNHAAGDRPPRRLKQAGVQTLVARQMVLVKPFDISLYCHDPTDVNEELALLTAMAELENHPIGLPLRSCATGPYCG